MQDSAMGRAKASSQRGGGVPHWLGAQSSDLPEPSQDGMAHGTVTEVVAVDLVDSLPVDLSSEIADVALLSRKQTGVARSAPEQKESPRFDSTRAHKLQAGVGRRAVSRSASKVVWQSGVEAEEQAVAGGPDRSLESAETAVVAGHEAQNGTLPGASAGGYVPLTATKPKGAVGTSSPGGQVVGKRHEEIPLELALVFGVTEEDWEDEVAVRAATRRDEGRQEQPVPVVVPVAPALWSPPPTSVGVFKAGRVDRSEQQDDGGPALATVTGRGADVIKKPMTRHAVFEELVKRSYGTSWQEAEVGALVEVDGSSGTVVTQDVAEETSLVEVVAVVEDVTEKVVAVAGSGGVANSNLRLVPVSPPVGPLAATPILKPVGDLFADLEAAVGPKVVESPPDDDAASSWAKFLALGTTGDSKEARIPWVRVDEEDTPVTEGRRRGEQGASFSTGDADAVMPVEALEPFDLQHVALITDGVVKQEGDAGDLGEEIIVRFSLAPRQEAHPDFEPEDDGVETVGLDAIEFGDDVREEDADLGDDHEDDADLGDDHEDVRLAVADQDAVGTEETVFGLAAAQLAVESALIEPTLIDPKVVEVARAGAVVVGRSDSVTPRAATTTETKHKKWDRSRMLQLEMELLSAIRESASAARESAIAVRESAFMARESAGAIRQAVQASAMSVSYVAPAAPQAASALVPEVAAPVAVSAPVMPAAPVASQAASASAPVSKVVPVVASAPVVSAPVVSAPVVSAPVVSAPVVSAPVASAPVVSASEVSPDISPVVLSVGSQAAVAISGIPWIMAEAATAHEEQAATVGSERTEQVVEDSEALQRSIGMVAGVSVSLVAPLSVATGSLAAVEAEKAGSSGVAAVVPPALLPVATDAPSVSSAFRVAATTASAGVSADMGGVAVPVESLTVGIVNALGDAVGSVVSQSRKVSAKMQGGKKEGQRMPMAAPVVEHIVRQTSAVQQKKNFPSILTRSPSDYSARMGGRVVGGVRGVFSGAGSIIIGGKDVVLGVIGCVTGTVGCLTDAVFCVGDTVLGESEAAKSGQLTSGKS